MYFRIFRIILTIIATSLLSCSSLQQLVVAPAVKIENVKIAGFSFEDVRLDFTLLVQNPNAFGVGLEGYNYSFAVQGKEFLSANETQRIEISAAGVSTLQIPLTLNFKKLYQVMAETKSLDSLSYQLTGAFQPTGLLSAFTIPFSHRGSLPNVRIPDISFSGLTVDRMGFTGVDLHLGIKLVNKNIFGFDIGKFNYDIALAGNAVAKGSTTQLASVPAKGKTEIALPISINFAGAMVSLTSLRALLNGENVSCSILGDAQLKTPFGPLNLPFNTTQVIPVIK
jgi:LEA14-like dessication related protein